MSDQRTRAHLCLENLHRVPEASQPLVDPRELSIGIVHLGLGAFHRAHQVVFTEEASALAGETRWGICSVNEHRAFVSAALRRQDGLFAVRSLAVGQPTTRVAASVREALYAPEAAEAVVERIADAQVTVVTLTVSEKGYHFEPATGRLRVDDPELDADVTGGVPRTPLGQLARGLELRRRRSGAPLTVLSCDNLPANGRTLRRLVGELLARRGGRWDAGLEGWIAEHVRFPCSMVDRIVPATTAEDRADVARDLGLVDEAPVVAEPFRAWVIEDDFAAEVPPWERAGASIVATVTPHEVMKLRVLNGTHTALACLGALAGIRTIAEALSVPALSGFAAVLLDQEILPTVTPPEGVDLERYRDATLERFRNPLIRYECTQVVSDTSQKLPQRLLGTISDCLARGTPPRALLLVVGAWLRLVSSGTDELGNSVAVSDPEAAAIRSCLSGVADPRRAAERALRLTSIFGELVDEPVVAELLREAFHALNASTVLDAAAVLGAGSSA